jgi:hypothetical protein
LIKRNNPAVPTKKRRRFFGHWDMFFYVCLKHHFSPLKHSIDLFSAAGDAVGSIVF